MKAEEGLAFVAVAVVFGIVAAAVLPENFWTFGGNVGLIGSPQTQGGNQVVSVAMQGPIDGGFSQQNLWAGSMPTAIPVAAPNTAIADRPVPQPGGVLNFEQAPRVQFYGQVQQITEVIQNDGQVHVWIHNPAGGEMQISVAPNWYLKLINCPLTHDSVISGMGFRFDRRNRDALVYAKKLDVSGRVCHLRNDEGFALWSNKLR